LFFGAAEFIEVFAVCANNWPEVPRIELQLQRDSRGCSNS
jgi:hypothetical protein